MWLKHSCHVWLTKQFQYTHNSKDFINGGRGQREERERNNLNDSKSFYQPIACWFNNFRLFAIPVLSHVSLSMAHEPLPPTMLAANEDADLHPLLTCYLINSYPFYNLGTWSNCWPMLEKVVSVRVLEQLTAGV